MALIGYVEETDFAEWLSARGVTLTGTASVLLTKALDWVELQSYSGTRTDDAQALSWPRKNVYIDGVLQDSATVPALVEELQIRVAVDIDQGTNPLSVRSQGVKSKSVDGAVSVEYMDGSSVATVSRQVSMILSKLSGGVGGMNIMVNRG